MPIFEIQTPDGKSFQVDAPDQNTAIQSLSGMMQQKEPSNSGFWSMGNEAMDLVTGGLQSKLNAAGGGLVDATIGAVKGEGFNYSDNYNKHLQFQRDAQNDYSDENPIRSGVGKAAGLGLAVTSSPIIGAGYKGAAATGAAYGGLFGAGQDADSIGERLQNTALGAGTGSVIGLGGYGLGNLAAKGATKISRAWDVVNAPPDIKAATKIGQLADDKFGPYSAHMLPKSVNDLGPDAVIGDVLGEPAGSLARSASNIDPAARETLETFVSGRKSMQNQRVVSDIEKAAGLPVGNRKSVQDMQKEAMDQARPAITKAYDAARKAGEDVPLEYFADVINSPVGEKVFAQAFNNQASRMATRGKGGGNLAVIDETKRLLDGMAKQGYRNADPMADVYADMAKHLRLQMDSVLQGNEYLTARMLRQKAYRGEEAFDIGEQLGQGRIPLDLPRKTAKIDPSLRGNTAKAYAATKADRLLNRGGTEGAINEMVTPMGREAAKAALGKNAGIVEKGVAREKTFNKFNRAVVGNSTTARQMAEMGLTGAGTAATTLAMGYDATTGGIAGILGALTRKGIPAITRKMSTDAQRKAAPIIAELLLKQSLPVGTSAAKGAGALERLANADKDKLLKAILFALSQHSQNTSPQMVPANQ